jgi:hypothetical protein
MTQCKLLVPMIIGGKFLRSGTTVNLEQIPIRMRKKKWISREDVGETEKNNHLKRPVDRGG